VERLADAAMTPRRDESAQQKEDLAQHKIRQDPDDKVTNGDDSTTGTDVAGGQIEVTEDDEIQKETVPGADAVTSIDL